MASPSDMPRTSWDQLPRNIDHTDTTDDFWDVYGLALEDVQRIYQQHRQIVGTNNTVAAILTAATFLHLGAIDHE